MKGKGIYPGFWHGVLLCIAFLICQFLFVIPVVVLDMALGTQILRHPLAMGAINLSSFAVTMGMAWLIGRQPWREVFPFKRVPLAALAGAMVSCSGAIIILSEVDNLMRMVLPMPPIFVEMFGNMRGGDESMLAGMFLMMFVAPVTEELMLRGVILRGYLQHFSLRTAVVASALLFGALHMNPWQFVSASLLGIIFGWWYARSRSLWPCLLGHGFANGVFWLGSLLPVEISGFNTPPEDVQLQPLWFDTVGAGLLAVGIWMFHRTTPRYFREPESLPAPPAVPPLLPPQLPQS